MGGFNRMLGACAAFVLTGVLAPDCGGQAAANAGSAVARRRPAQPLAPRGAARDRAWAPGSGRCRSSRDHAVRDRAGDGLPPARPAHPGDRRGAWHRRESAAAGVRRPKHGRARRSGGRDLDRLSMLRGEDFDRQFWVTLARDHLAASDLLAAAAGTVSSLDPLVDEAVRLLDRSIRRATAAEGR